MSTSITSLKRDGTKKGKRRRTVLSKTQQHKLEWYFRQDPWPNRHKKEKLALETGRDETFVSTWFQNRRAKQKRREDLELLGIDKSIKIQVKDDKVVVLGEHENISLTRSPETKCGECSNLISVDKAIGGPSLKIQMANQTLTCEKTHPGSVICQVANTGEAADTNPQITPVASPKQVTSRFVADPASLDGSVDTFNNVASVCDSRQKSLTQASSLPLTSTDSTVNNVPDHGQDVPPPMVINASYDIGIRNAAILSYFNRAKTSITSKSHNSGTPQLYLSHHTKGQKHYGNSSYVYPTVDPVPDRNVNDSGTDDNERQEKHDLDSKSSKQPRMKITTGKGMNASLVNTSSVQETVASPLTLNPPSLFRALTKMMALSEGGIIDPSDPDFNSSANDALYGIILNGDSRIIYDKMYGLDILSIDDF